MQRLIAIVFLFSFLFSGTEMHELFKLPHLLSHYVEHAKTSDDISLFEFLEQHYLAHDSKSSDAHTNHGCLPFQCKDSAHSLGYVILNNLQDVVLTNEILTANKIVFSPKHCISSFNGSVWQPPKIA